MDPDSFARYQRQMALPDFGMEGQRALCKATVAIAGLGGLGSAAAIYLATAGVGNLLLIDHQSVELSNLNRQILYSPADLDHSKSVRAKKRLQAMNPDVQIRIDQKQLTASNAHNLLRDAAAVVDGLDSIQARLALNRACFNLGIPFVHAAVGGYSGQLLVCRPPAGPCLECLYSEIGATDPVPILGPVAGIMGALQAVEIIKILTGAGKASHPKFIVADFHSNRFDTIALKRRPDCPICAA